MKTIKVIIGSTRENNKGLKVGKWIMEETSKFQGDLKFELVNLADYNLPNYNEPSSPRSSQDYKYETTRVWSKVIKEADGFIFVTPEYNGYFTGALKDAIDYLYYEWLNKPYGIIGYGSEGAKRAVSQLHNLLMSSFNMDDLKVTVGINQVWSAFDKEDNLLEECIDGDIQELFNVFK